MPIHQVIQDLAQAFAEAVLQASVEAEKGHRATPRTRGRASVKPTESDALKRSVVAALKVEAPDGLRAEELRSVFKGVRREEMSKALRHALAEGAVRKTGRLRGTTYFAKS